MINKQLMVYNFNKAANQYLYYADIQKIPAFKIHSLIKNQLNDSLLVLDLGSGPGTFGHLQEFTMTSNLILYDISLHMLKCVPNKEYTLINGDAELLPFIDSRFDVVISNLMLQWINDKQKALKEINRVMQTEGTFIFTSLINSSLWQLKTVWAEIDDKTHVLDFISDDEYKFLCQNAGFEIIQQQQWSDTLFFANCNELLYHFKKTGTNMPKINQRGLGGVNILNELSKIYEKFRTADGLPLTYSYILIYGKKI